MLRRDLRRRNARRAGALFGFRLLVLVILVVVACTPLAGAQGRSGETGVAVVSLAFTGAVELLTEEQRESLAQGAAGRTLDLAGLQAIADRATQLAQDNGRLLAFAYLPPQDVTEGIVRVALAEGVVESWLFDLGAGTRIRPERLMAIAHSAARPAQPLTKQGLERALLLMGDEAGVDVRSTLQAGDVPNTTRVMVTVNEGPVVTGSLSVNNHGSFTTGSRQATTTLSINDAFGFGERFDVTGLMTEGVRMARVGGEVGIGGSGLRITGRLSASSYTVVAGAAALADVTGETRSWLFGARYPLIRSRGVNLYGRLQYESSVSTDRVMDVVTSKAQTGSWLLGLAGDSYGIGGQTRTTWSGTLKSGTSDLLEGTSPGDAGQFLKATLEFSRVLALNRSLELLARAKGQWAGQNLRSGEKFALGGPTGVRAYPVGEASGDLGAVASIELRYSTPTSARKALQLSGFVDVGWIQLYHDPPATIPTQTGRNTYPLFGIGIGAVWRATPTLSIEGGWARAVGENLGRSIFGTDVDGGTGASRLWVQVQWAF